MMKKTIFILFIFIASCGYKPIYLNNNLKNIEYNKINIDGEIEIGKKIINSLSLRENTSNKQLSDLTLFSSFKIDEIAKNSKGQTETYRSSIVVSVKIIDDQKIIKNKTFSDDFTYNKKNNKFELTEYQEDVKNQLVNRIIEDLILFLNM
tara:strand:+ start:554 stop:1003 length:450 start_codon:yes stop_codon:yes gene_type:complete